MFYAEIKDLLNKLNSENIEELKLILTRKVNELILKIDDDNISDSIINQKVFTKKKSRTEMIK